MVIVVGNKNYPENYEQLINRREDLWSCGAYDCIFFFSCKDSRKWPNPNVYIINRITFHSSRLFPLQRSNHLIRPILDLWKTPLAKSLSAKHLCNIPTEHSTCANFPPQLSILFFLLLNVCFFFLRYFVFVCFYTSYSQLCTGISLCPWPLPSIGNYICSFFFFFFFTLTIFRLFPMWLPDNSFVAEKKEEKNIFFWKSNFRC